MKALSILIQVLDGKLGKCFEVWSALDFQNSVPKIWSVSALPIVLWLGDSAGWSEANDHGGAPHALQNRVARLHRAGRWAAGRCVVDADPKVNWLWLESCRENHGKLLGHPDWTPRCAPLSLYKAALDILQGTCGLENSLMLWSPENQWEATGVDFHLLVQAAWRAWTWWSSAKRFGLCSLVQYGWGGATCHGWGKSPLISDGRFADFPSCPSAFFPYMFVFFMCSFSWYDEIYAHIYLCHFMPPFREITLPCWGTRQFARWMMKKPMRSLPWRPMVEPLPRGWRLTWMTRFTEGPVEHLGSLLSKVIHKQITAEMFMIRWR